VATAIVKDVFDGERRESILALVQSMVLISPAVAPVLGAALLQITSWQGIFWTLAGVGLVAVAGAVAFEETCVERNTGPIVESFGRLVRVLQNRRFTALLIVFSLASISSMAFIASSSYIYIDGFGVNAQVYSYYFTLNAIALILGPLLYLRLVRRFRRELIVAGCFSAIALSGVLVCSIGNLQPWVFALVLLPASFAGSCVRPPGTNLMLEQQSHDTGSAASLMGSVGLLMGSLGMLIMSAGSVNRILMLGILQIIIGLGCITLWTVVRQRVLLPAKRR
jgi:DHA1 family bicyclomycin/chloramphenicol resistance-like MFS transporter